MSDTQRQSEAAPPSTARRGLPNPCKPVSKTFENILRLALNGPRLSRSTRFHGALLNKTIPDIHHSHLFTCGGNSMWQRSEKTQQWKLVTVPDSK